MTARDALAVQRDILAPFAIDALDDGIAQRARHQRRGRRAFGIELILAHAAAHQQHIAKSLGGDKAGFGASAGKHGVGSDRRAVHDAYHRREKIINWKPSFARELFETVQHPFGRIFRRGESLLDDGASVGLHQNTVGKSPTDVDTDQRACFNPGHCAVRVEARIAAPKSLGKFRASLLRIDHHETFISIGIGIGMCAREIFLVHCSHPSLKKRGRGRFIAIVFTQIFAPRPSAASVLVGSPAN